MAVLTKRGLVILVICTNLTANKIMGQW